MGFSLFRDFGYPAFQFFLSRKVFPFMADSGQALFIGQLGVSLGQQFQPERRSFIHVPFGPLIASITFHRAQLGGDGSCTDYLSGQ